jgi:oligopeptide/dipeptide ABC transporter ATP-binding protein
MSSPSPNHQSGSVILDTTQLLAVDGLNVGFSGAGGIVPIVRSISYHIIPGRTLGVVGESGCGKSMTALALMGLIPSGGGIQGSIRLKGQELVGLSDEEYRNVRGARIAMIFQEPMTALNPVMTIGEQIAEVLRLHKGMDRNAAAERAVGFLDSVHIPSASRRALDYPHQLSGGMRQRAMIAMALAGEPELLIADEPTTALDVTIQAQIVDLMLELQERTGMAIQFISHNLGLISELADRVVVMYAGVVVESAPADELFANPRHPYTIGLMATLPDLERRVERLPTIPGMVPDPRKPMAGCRFHPRCALADDQCRRAEPALGPIGAAHEVACFKVANS